MGNRPILIINNNPFNGNGLQNKLSIFNQKLYIFL